MSDTSRILEDATTRMSKGQADILKQQLERGSNTAVIEASEKAKNTSDANKHAARVASQNAAKSGHSL